MTRIIAGSLKGRRLRVPERGTRPTSDRVRESIFNTLDATGLLDDGCILDLCAGSGALGLEAYSRGAQHVDLVELAAGAARICERNISDLGAAGVQVHRQDAVSFLRSHAAASLCGEDCYDVVFIDPPYTDAAALIGQCAAAIRQGHLLAADGLLIAESASRTAPQELPGWQVWRRKDYGDTAVVWWELVGIS